MLKSKSFSCRIFFYTTLIFLLTSFGCVKKLTSVCTLEQLEVRGFRLGGSLRDFEQKYPDKTFSKVTGGEENGLMIGRTSIDIYAADQTKYPELKGLESISFAGAGGKIVEIKFYYDDSIDTSDQFKTEFFRKIQESLKLTGEWQQSTADKDTKIMNCGKYKIEAGLNAVFDPSYRAGSEGWKKYKPFLKIEDVETKNTLRQAENSKRQEEYQKKRDEFKP